MAISTSRTLRSPDLSVPRTSPLSRPLQFPVHFILGPSDLSLVRRNQSSLCDTLRIPSSLLCHVIWRRSPILPVISGIRKEPEPWGLLVCPRHRRLRRTEMSALAQIRPQPTVCPLPSSLYTPCSKHPPTLLLGLPTRHPYDHLISSTASW